MYTVLGEREITEPIITFSLKRVKTGGSDELFGVAVILYELAIDWGVHCAVILFDVTV